MSHIINLFYYRIILLHYYTCMWCVGIFNLPPTYNTTYSLVCSCYCSCSCSCYQNKIIFTLHIILAQTIRCEMDTVFRFSHIQFNDSTDESVVIWATHPLIEVRKTLTSKRNRRNSEMKKIRIRNTLFSFLLQRKLNIKYYLICKKKNIFFPVLNFLPLTSTHFPFPASSSDGISKERKSFFLLILPIFIFNYLIWTNPSSHPLNRSAPGFLLHQFAMKTYTKGNV